MTGPARADADGRPAAPDLQFGPSTSPGSPMHPVMIQNA